MSITEAAPHLGVSRKTLSKVLNGRGAITPEMAFNPSAESWLRQQSAYDLWHAPQHSNDLKVSPVEIHVS